jgi:hypothetical protein
MGIPTPDNYLWFLLETHWCELYLILKHNCKAGLDFDPRRDFEIPFYDFQKFCPLKNIMTYLEYYCKKLKGHIFFPSNITPDGYFQILNTNDNIYINVNGCIYRECWSRLEHQWWEKYMMCENCQAVGWIPVNSSEIPEKEKQLYYTRKTTLEQNELANPYRERRSRKRYWEDSY